MRSSTTAVDRQCRVGSGRHGWVATVAGDRTHQYGALRVRGDLLGGQLTGIDQLSDQCVVAGELGQLVARAVVGA
jgi:hypothetical protein